MCLYIFGSLTTNTDLLAVQVFRDELCVPCMLMERMKRTRKEKRKMVKGDREKERNEATKKLIIHQRAECSIIRRLYTCIRYNHAVCFEPSVPLNGDIIRNRFGKRQPTQEARHTTCISMIFSIQRTEWMRNRIEAHWFYIWHDEECCDGLVKVYANVDTITP